MKMMKSTVIEKLKFVGVFLFLVEYAQLGWSIDCYKCVSIGGNNEECDDPFHNNGSDYLESPCMAGRKARDGLFPATACVKLVGTFADSGISMTVRACALDSGTLTTDTEIVRMSHCGGFYFQNEYVNGCVQSCDDSDGCNGSQRRYLSIHLSIASILTSFWSFV